MVNEAGHTSHKVRAVIENESTWLDINVLANVRRDGPLVLPWPSPGNPGAILSFATAEQWRDFVSALGLRSGIPDIVTAKFRRAQMLYFLAWAYFDLIKAGELVGLMTLELALKDRYGNKRNGRASFAKLLRYLISDGLTDEQIPMIRKTGGSAIGRITSKSKPSLSEMRNSQAHGDPFDGFPCSGLLELVRDLIEYAYRDVIQQRGGLLGG